ncbi:MAG: putative transport system permease protein [Cryptosporangiaceae bacterium]|nr:putative transport system permease protein [Cryptosporangiaceae bacterium]
MRSRERSLRPARLAFGDVLRVGAAGLRSRRMRVFLSALGITIGIAAMISVVGISSSSRADLDHKLSALGTNLLTASPANGAGETVPLPDTAVPMVSRMAAVESVSAVGRVGNAAAYRNEHIPAAATNSIGVYATRLDLLKTIRSTVSTGHWLTDPGARFPTVVLGAEAAQRLGIDHVTGSTQIVVGDLRFTVVGILARAQLATELDSGAFVGWPAAKQYLGFDGHPTGIYVRSRTDVVPEVRAVLGRTINPQAPEIVRVTRPSDLLIAQAATEQAFTGLMLGLGAVALLVGGIGVANTMVISVLERRAEIGLRRALGATRGQVRLQFLVESLLLSALGGLGGVLFGVLATTAYSVTRNWVVYVPPWATVGGLGATLAVGAIAGLYPAVRAARLAPTEALTGS